MRWKVERLHQGLRSSWIGKVWEGAKQLLLASCVVQSDDTGIMVIDASTSQGSRHSYLSVYVNDRDEVVFDFTLGRGREGQAVFLDDYRGRLQVDAYSGYDEVLPQNGLIAVGCWAHARRRFYQALESEPDAKSAMEVIRRMDRVVKDARVDPSAQSSGVGCGSPSRSRSWMRCICGSRVFVIATCPRARWATRSATRCGGGTRFFATSTTAGSTSTTTESSDRCAASPWVGRTGCLLGRLQERDELRPSTRW